MTLSMTTPFTTSRTKLFLRSASLQSCLRGLELLAHLHPPMPLIRGIAPVIAQIVRRTMATAMAAGITGMVISMAANLAATRGTEAYSITGDQM